MFHDEQWISAILREIVEGITKSDIWADNWCPVCQEHPSNDHGGKDCPLRSAIKWLELNE